MKFFLIFLATLPLLACVGTSDNNDPYAAAKLNEFSVKGTDGISASSKNNASASINYSQGNGSFSLEFSGDFAYGNHAAVYLSNSPTEINESNKFFGRNCGSSISAVSHCKNSYKTTCTVDKNGVFACLDDSYTKNLLSFINSNERLYLVLTACNVMTDECDKKSIPVTLK